MVLCGGLGPRAGSGVLKAAMRSALAGCTRAGGEEERQHAASLDA